MQLCEPAVLWARTHLGCPARRSGKALGWSAMGSWKHEVFFGWNLGSDSTGTIAVGDELTVTRTRTAPMAA